MAQKTQKVCYEARYFQDFSVGDLFQTGTHRVTKEEIIAFARQYDPQPYHLDESAAEKSMFKGLIASGFMTLGIGFALSYRTGVLDHMMGGRGLDELRWLVPVRPGDVLMAKARVVSTRPSSRDVSRGTVVFDYSIINQRNEAVLTMKAHQMIATRPQ